MLYGALEAGGTKMVCAIGNENGEILEQVKFPTETPETTMPQIFDYFKGKDIKALGIACFGPIDLRTDSPTYGSITSTPKKGWSGYNIVKAAKEALGIPVGFDTDVNGSLLGEVTWGCAKGLSDAIYLTIGTGIGGGIMTNGKLLHGMLHPEAGHLRLPRLKNDPGKSVCPYHDNCFEGLASGPSIKARWGKTADLLTDNNEVWEIEAEYIATALMDYAVILSPKKIILGGGVMHQEQLFPMIRAKFKELVNGYIVTDEMNHLDDYIVPASLNDNQGIMGAVKLAMDACE
ncbi:ROK family protein [Butyrivibrio sp. WCE2006]|uniref:ROK family protein n=1 Tax=Butyrivibrio sp. WCE2006 TaxID=1410611 RepID=UPI0005D14B48|nr:ROK family protein [Butyrivibrio sp. WCE2006]